MTTQISRFSFLLRLVVFSSAMTLGLGMAQSSGVVGLKGAGFRRTGGGGLCRVGGVQESFLGYTRVQCATLAFQRHGSAAAFEYHNLTQNCSLLSSRDGFYESDIQCDNYRILSDSSLEDIARTFTVSGLITPYKLICSVQGVGVNYGCRSFIDNNPKTELISTNVSSLASILHNQTNLTEPLQGWLIIHQRLSNNLTYTRPWASYKQGFGSVTWWLSDFWIGLEAMHNLTMLTNGQPAGFSLRIEILRTYDMEWYWAEYGEFWVDNESQNYTLHISGYNGTAGDSLDSGVLAMYSLNGQSFSTMDRDNDQSSYSCSIAIGGTGWWYNNCMAASLTAPVLNYCWDTLNSTYLPLRQLSASRMMIRKIV